MNSPLNDDHTGIDEAAEYLGLKLVTPRTWAEKKADLPAHRVGKLWKFKHSEPDKWIFSGKSAIEQRG